MEGEAVVLAAIAVVDGERSLGDGGGGADGVVIVTGKLTGDGVALDEASGDDGPAEFLGAFVAQASFGVLGGDDKRSGRDLKWPRQQEGVPVGRLVAGDFGDEGEADGAAAKPGGQPLVGAVLLQIHILLGGDEKGRGLARRPIAEIDEQRRGGAVDVGVVGREVEGEVAAERGGAGADVRRQTQPDILAGRVQNGRGRVLQMTSVEQIGAWRQPEVAPLRILETGIVAVHPVVVGLKAVRAGVLRQQRNVAQTLHRQMLDGAERDAGLLRQQLGRRAHIAPDQGIQ